MTKHLFCFFFEVDLENDRYATRATEIFSDKSARPIIVEGFDFVTEAPVPTVEKINQEHEFYAMTISSDEFESVYQTKNFSGSITFPK